MFPRAGSRDMSFLMEQTPVVSAFCTLTSPAPGLSFFTLDSEYRYTLPPYPVLGFLSPSLAERAEEEAAVLKAENSEDAVLLSNWKWVVFNNKIRFSSQDPCIHLCACVCKALFSMCAPQNKLPRWGGKYYVSTFLF